MSIHSVQILRPSPALLWWLFNCGESNMALAFDKHGTTSDSDRLAHKFIANADEFRQTGIENGGSRLSHVFGGTRWVVEKTVCDYSFFFLNAKYAWQSDMRWKPGALFKQNLAKFNIAGRVGDGGIGKVKKDIWRTNSKEKDKMMDDILGKRLCLGIQACKQDKRKKKRGRKEWRKERKTNKKTYIYLSAHTHR